MHRLELTLLIFYPFLNSRMIEKKSIYLVCEGGIAGIFLSLMDYRCKSSYEGGIISDKSRELGLKLFCDREDI